MHIVYVIAPGGGPEAAVKTFLPWLEQAGHRISIVYVAPKDKVTSVFPPSVQVSFVNAGPAHYYLAKVGIGWHALPLRVRAWELARAVNRALTRINHQQKIDLVEVIEGIPISLWSQPWRVAVRAHASDWTVRYFCNDGERSNDKWLIAQEAGQLRRADGVGALSRHLADHLSEFCNYPRHLIEVVPYPIDTEEFCSGERTGTEAPPVILSIGRLEKRKGMDVLIRALTKGVWQRYPDLKVHMLGAEGDLTRTGLLSLVPADKRAQVIFPGFAERRNLPGYYQRATLYVSATWYESFGYTILEAMACGTAVVATRVGGVPELVEEGLTGVLVPPRNENALAQAIIELLDDPTRRQEMGAQGRERAVENFAVDKVMAQTLGFYERAMTQANTR